MKLLLLYIVATGLSSPAAIADERDVAAAPEEPAAERSFFEPKTEADLNAMAALDSELVTSLNQEKLN